MFASLGRAMASLFEPASLWTMVKALLITLVLFALLLWSLEVLIHRLPTLGYPWVNQIVVILAPVLVLLGLFAVGGPVAAVFASLYLDRIADAIEAKAYPNDPKAPGMSFGTGLSAALRLAGLVILVDLVLLPAEVILPGVGEILMVIANGFLLGREYYELAALRHLSRGTAEALRKRNGGRIFAAGLIISVMTVIPFANFIAPLFGSALMVHLFKRISKESPA